MLEETKGNKKSFEIVMLDSQKSRVNRSKDLKKKKEAKSEVKYFQTGRISSLGFRMSCGLSVNPISVRVIMYTKLVIFWCAAYPLALCNCLLLPLRIFERFIFCRVLANSRIFGPHSNTSNYHNFVNIGS